MQEWKSKDINEQQGLAAGASCSSQAENALVSVSQIALEALRRAGRDLTVDSLVSAMESLHEFTDLYGNTYSFGPNQHHGSTKASLAVVANGRWVPVLDKPLGY